MMMWRGLAPDRVVQAMRALSGRKLPSGKQEIPATQTSRQPEVDTRLAAARRQS